MKTKTDNNPLSDKHRAENIIMNTNVFYSILILFQHNALIAILVIITCSSMSQCVSLKVRFKAISYFFLETLFYGHRGDSTQYTQYIF